MSATIRTPLAPGTALAPLIERLLTAYVNNTLGRDYLAARADLEDYVTVLQAERMRLEDRLKHHRDLRREMSRESAALVNQVSALREQLRIWKESEAE
jgi:hypothetical protein